MPEDMTPNNTNESAASQTLIDEVAFQPTEEPVDETAERRALPKITIASFYDHRHLRRMVKLAIAGYVMVAIVPLVYLTYQAWQTNRDLARTWEQREAQYIHPLVTIDIATYQQEKEAIFSAFQETRDPVYAMYALDLLADRSGIGLRNPQYSFNSGPVPIGELPRGVEIQAIVLGNGAEISRFLNALRSFKPLLTVADLRITPSSVEESGLYQASVLIAVGLLPELPEDTVPASGKVAAQEPIPYPIANSQMVLERLQQLQTIPFAGLGQSVIGKRNLFGIE